MKRRRFLGITASACAAAVADVAGAAPGSPMVWRGEGMGAWIELTILTTREESGRFAIDQCVKTLRHLELLFSLYLPDSAINELNRSGELLNPPREFRHLLSIGNDIARRTSGWFDISVQPLWLASRQQENSLNMARIAQSVVDWRSVIVEDHRVYFARPDMAITMNGIAQGFIADSLCDSLSAAGFDDILVNAGEFRAGRGSHVWNIGVGRPDGNDIQEIVRLKDGAVATSSSVVVDRKGEELIHLFDPVQGVAPHHWSSVTVLAENATQADAWSTALCVAPKDAVWDLVAGSGIRQVLLLDEDNNLTSISAG